MKSKKFNIVLILIKNKTKHIQKEKSKNQLTVNAVINVLKQLYKNFEFCAKERSEMDMFNIGKLEPCD